jgi:hypothetical protein
MTTEAERRQRARERASWPIRKFALGTEPGDDLSGETTGEERLAMMWELARQAWRLSDRPFPGYDRASTPGRVVRNGR